MLYIKLKMLEEIELKLLFNRYLIYKNREDLK